MTLAPGCPLCGHDQNNGFPTAVRDEPPAASLAGHGETLDQAPLTIINRIRRQGRGSAMAGLFCYPLRSAVSGLLGRSGDSHRGLGDLYRYLLDPLDERVTSFFLRSCLHAIGLAIAGWPVHLSFGNGPQPHLRDGDATIAANRRVGDQGARPRREQHIVMFGDGWFDRARRRNGRGANA